jgi:hypothetical protein
MAGEHSGLAAVSSSDSLARFLKSSVQVFRQLSFKMVRSGTRMHERGLNGEILKQSEPVSQDLLEEDDVLWAASDSIFILRQRPRMTMVANRTQ